MRNTFRVLFYVNGSKAKNGVVPIMGRITVNGQTAQFSCKQTVPMPIESVSKILGHTNITTTQIYAKITTDKLERDMSVFGEKLEAGLAAKVLVQTPTSPPAQVSPILPRSRPEAAN